MKKITSLLVSIVLIANASFGYTLTLKKGDFTLSRTGIGSGTNMNFGNNIPMVWNVISGGVTPTRAGTEGKQATFEMPGEDVSIEIFDAYTITAGSNISPAGESYVKPGDSITYTIVDNDPTSHINYLIVNGAPNYSIYNKNVSRPYTFTPTGDTSLGVYMAKHDDTMEVAGSGRCAICGDTWQVYRYCLYCNTGVCSECGYEGNYEP